MIVDNQPESIEQTSPKEEPAFDKFLKDLESCTASTKKQIKTLQHLHDSEQLFEKYIKHSGNLRELFEFLDETVEELNELQRSNQQINISETNADIVLACIEKACLYYQNKIKQNDDPNRKLLLTDNKDLKQKFNTLCTNLTDKYIKLITRCLKLRSGTKKTIELQETCVRLLTICINQTVDLAKKIALEYECFNEFKNWLERFLLMRQTDLREYSVQFLISFFKYIKTSTDPENEDSLVISVDREYMLIIKKIFLTEHNPQQQQKGLHLCCFCNQFCWTTKFSLDGQLWRNSLQHRLPDCIANL